MIATSVAALLVAAAGAAANPVDLDPRQVGSQVSTGNNLCLDLRGGNTADGTAAQLWDCSQSRFSHWSFANIGNIVSRDAGGGNLCLDAGRNPGDGTTVHVAQCEKNPPVMGQFWTYIYGRVKIRGTNLCLDVKDGNFVNGAQLQVWWCDLDSPNQAWNFN
ncbi:Extracellular exo-alpha-L-arabinofuranosidase [Vanrija pseudolonga]|uniref:Extracellular exo-alpha-L-arabinofuranosidase n=1 Tax=Vanrija pseudolonga TaxID=143232 RepID=A0AAF0Y515_9TREE|nr:Extracellular exo-alpha-L-arabinofuranosidase [Vanrija pseudolonga]